MITSITSNPAYVVRHCELIEYLAKHQYNTRDGLHVDTIYKTWDELPDDVKEFFRNQQDHLAKLLLSNFIRPAFINGLINGTTQNINQITAELGYNE